MTWIVTWNDREYDVDPSEFSGRELSLIKQRTGLTWKTLTEGVLGFDGDAIRSLFWIVDLRSQPELKFSDYDGPSLRLVVAHLEGLGEAMETLVPKALREESGTPTTSTTGSPSSPSDSDGPEASTTS